MASERANEIAEGIGIVIGRIMRAGIIIAGSAGLIISVVATGEATSAPVKSAAISKPTVAHKPVKKAVKKCHCNCKKVVDKPVEAAKTVSIENIEATLIGPRD
jgi:hypothetical protein